MEETIQLLAELAYWGALDLEKAQRHCSDKLIKQIKEKAAVISRGIDWANDHYKREMEQ